jgi:hypothetical protein
MGNPNPKYKFKQADVGEVAAKPVSVKLPIEIDKFVRSLPNRTEWLRQVIVEAAEREKTTS